MFAEGITDIKYIKKAAELLNKEDILLKCTMFDGDEHGNLGKIWKHYNTKLSNDSPQKVLLLYDCEQEKEDAQNGKVFKRTLKIIDDNIIKTGIENLLPTSLIQQAMKANATWIDHYASRDTTIKGYKKTDPEKYEVNKNEKSSLCDWICENGKKNDFQHFNMIFDLLEDTILKKE